MKPEDEDTADRVVIAPVHQDLTEEPKESDKKGLECVMMDPIGSGSAVDLESESESEVEPENTSTTTQEVDVHVFFPAAIQKPATLMVQEELDNDGSDQICGSSAIGPGSADLETRDSNVDPGHATGQAAALVGPVVQDNADLMEDRKGADDGTNDAMRDGVVCYESANVEHESSAAQEAVVVSSAVKDLGTVMEDQNRSYDYDGASDLVRGGAVRPVFAKQDVVVAGPITAIQDKQGQDDESEDDAKIKDPTVEHGCLLMEELVVASPTVQDPAEVIEAKTGNPMQSPPLQEISSGVSPTPPIPAHLRSQEPEKARLDFSKMELAEIMACSDRRVRGVDRHLLRGSVVTTKSIPVAEKAVFVEFTTDRWQTYKEVEAMFVSTEDSKTSPFDRFRFEMDVDKLLFRDAAIGVRFEVEFAVAHRTQLGEVVWDSNGGHNFKVVMMRSK
ncbi:hypothetical protein HK102_004028 [Quaeritorhiza haematococci]|nr:hypothetical protein HK102_004028 [Quaeritorhiza haematococci]